MKCRASARPWSHREGLHFIGKRLLLRKSIVRLINNIPRVFYESFEGVLARIIVQIVNILLKIFSQAFLLL